jgi:hypothetical protein
MTREEFYVAASRTRGETFLYATPEVQAAREEIAPASPYLRSGLDHIAEAAERSGAQTAAMDEALRSRFAQMPSDQLASRLRELRAEVGAEHQDQEARRRHAERVRENELRIERIEEAREGLPEPGRLSDRAERERTERDLDLREGMAREEAERLAAEARELPDVRHEARAEEAVIESVLADRERLAATAARISPPDYITTELGERPADPSKAAAWDKAVRGVESYRLRNGIVDRDSALGPRPADRGAHREHERARASIEQAQRQLQLQRSAERSIDQGIAR